MKTVDKIFLFNFSDLSTRSPTIYTCFPPPLFFVFGTTILWFRVYTRHTFVKFKLLRFRFNSFFFSIEILIIFRFFLSFHTHTHTRIKLYSFFWVSHFFLLFSPFRSVETSLGWTGVEQDNQHFFFFNFFCDFVMSAKLFRFLPRFFRGNKDKDKISTASNKFCNYAEAGTKPGDYICRIILLDDKEVNLSVKVSLPQFFFFFFDRSPHLSTHPCVFFFFVVKKKVIFENLSLC